MTALRLAALAGAAVAVALTGGCGLSGSADAGVPGRPSASPAAAGSRAGDEDLAAKRRVWDALFASASSDEGPDWAARAALRSIAVAQETRAAQGRGHASLRTLVSEGAPGLAIPSGVTAAVVSFDAEGYCLAAFAADGTGTVVYGARDGEAVREGCSAPAGQTAEAWGVPVPAEPVSTLPEAAADLPLEQFLHVVLGLRASAAAASAPQAAAGAAGADLTSAVLAAAGLSPDGAGVRTRVERDPDGGWCALVGYEPLASGAVTARSVEVLAASAGSGDDLFGGVRSGGSGRRCGDGTRLVLTEEMKRAADAASDFASGAWAWAPDAPKPSPVPAVRFPPLAQG